MSHNARDQKKLAKKKAKRQEKRTVIATQTSKDPTVRLAAAAAWPIIDALVAEEIWKKGIGYVVLSRRMPDGGIAMASMLVDILCLGVKNSLWTLTSTFTYQEALTKYRKEMSLARVAPEYVVKLVTEAVDFARSFGFPPHADYRHACLLFAGIDPNRCTDTFTFGENGKPLYIAGPFETASQSQSIRRRVVLAGGYLAASLPEDETEIGQLPSTAADDLPKLEGTAEG